MNAADLVAMPEDDVDEFVGWIDWRSPEEEVVYAVQAQTGEPLECRWDGDTFLLDWAGSVFRIPLTISHVDRYVAINSLAEILKDKYRFYLRDGFEGSDTHGLLVVSKECATELERDHNDWLQDKFDELPPGVDLFSGLRVPYYGNENNNPNLREELAREEAEQEAFREELRNSPDLQKIGRDIRVKIGTATPREKFFHYFRRYWWVIFFLLWVWLRK